MDTDHPVFQQPAPEYVEAPEDLFLEELLEESERLKIIFSPLHIRLIRALLIKAFKRLITAPSGSVAYYREMDRLSAIFAYIKDASNSLKALDCVAYAFGIICRDGESMESVARQHGVSRQAFSRQIDDFQEEFRIAPRSGMRPAAQKQIYRQVHETRWAHIEQDAPRKIA